MHWHKLESRMIHFAKCHGYETEVVWWSNKVSAKCVLVDTKCSWVCCVIWSMPLCSSTFYIYGSLDAILSGNEVCHGKVSPVKTDLTTPNLDAKLVQSDWFGRPNWVQLDQFWHPNLVPPNEKQFGVRCYFLRLVTPVIRCSYVQLYGWRH